MRVGRCQASRAEASWDDAYDEGPGPAALATQGLLEWPLLCEHVARFASTTLGRQATLRLEVPVQEAASQKLLRETAAMDVLESQYAASLDFGGMSTDEAETALRRVRKGGMLTGRMLNGVASVLIGAASLRASITSAARSATDSGETSILRPLSGPVREVETHPEVIAAIRRAISEEGIVQPTASEKVRQTRQRVSAVEGRLRNILNGHPGEATEHGGRMCVAVSASDSQPKGVLLGTMASGLATYIEPSAAVPLNNERSVVKAEMWAAEEEVLWMLTGLLADALEDVARALEVVVWLDCTAAKARYGRWIDGVMPRIIPFPKSGKPRKRAQQAAQTSKRRAPESADELPEGAEDHLLRLQRFRHPLLLGNYLLWREKHGRQKRSSAKASPRASRLSTRKDNLQQLQANPNEPPETRKQVIDAMWGTSAGKGGGREEEQHSKPIPMDLSIKSHLRAVIITGPNTGGKTASLKVRF
ncbi:hypothetical protein WJX84_002049 [Apatococcus fuscideae]|uniref:DNA mismatch repair protein MutS core domain-containing protein n=1 Tax=Apatococcus fuscideae TaxID=2026836 RepID=A0AAW1T906_9CHLO